MEAHGINRLNENSLVYFKEINHLFNEICDYIIFKDSFDAFFIQSFKKQSMIIIVLITLNTMKKSICC